jgi:hypothetical protein
MTPGNLPAKEKAEWWFMNPRKGRKIQENADLN